MKQKSGANSQNFQINGDVNYGVSASEARKIALDVFKANFYEFSEKAAQKALKRAEEITDEFLESFYQRLPKFEYKLQEPSVQSSMYNMQKEYAKLGDDNLKKQLLELLIQRIEAEERSLKQIVLDEAISILPKLTNEQINILTLIFSSVYYNHKEITNIESLKNLINNKLIVFYPLKQPSFSFFTHLKFTGCCSILSEGSTYKPLEEIFRSRYKALFVKGFTEEQLLNKFGDKVKKLEPLLIQCLQNADYVQFNQLNDDAFKQAIKKYNLEELGKDAISFQDEFVMNNEEVKDFLISINPKMEELLNDWKDKDLKTITPTSVGIVIAILNFNKCTKENVVIDKFI